MIRLLATALIQVMIVFFSGSVALLADTIHNFGDAATAVLLWMVFRLAIWKPSNRFTYGYGRAENLAGMAIVFTILFSALLAGYASMDRLFHPQADSIVGLLITVAIFRIAWNSAKAVFTCLLDGVDLGAIDGIKRAVNHTQGVLNVTEVRARWLGHRLHPELNVAVDGSVSVEEGHGIAKELRHQLLHHLRYISNAVIHVDPMNASGEKHYRLVGCTNNIVD
ncbi:MAG: cation diffusion facilitator family transporter [Candidatus Zixiibacteriota bacterium]